MGAWGPGHFDNDGALDFVDDLLDAPAANRVDLVRRLLVRAVDTEGYLEIDAGSHVVVAAALIAAQCPGGEPVSDSRWPLEPLPAFPDDLRSLAVEALDRVLADGSGLAELWSETASAEDWRREVLLLRRVLDQPMPGEVPLFEV
ncbi:MULTISPECIES: DUF4259 domain-containing protein [unclassified Pseudofrankia]|uniref:DUF4259 domain-containing protein n=1 Tax=unclassified Pseudofrankia TaxID=2994372 RepID=UPI0008D9A21D|nr:MULTISPECIES: DUF4259 domain-containing protein [unclassified Pseudofrankia]MDT3443436.1 DUF4259 domain-containing protein [Pseudofrankia sp. BMG5.37]OHV45323.1 hypothetical protein BCD48_23050 [Pseudofrankia sp. BMG5.36]